MAVTPGIWRQAGWLGLAFALGICAAAGVRGDTATATTVGIASLLAVVGLAVWSGRRWDRSMEALQKFVTRWDTGLESADLTEETIPELDLLRLSLQRTHQTLRKEQGRRDQRITDLHRDTLLLQSVLSTMVEAVIVVDGNARLMYVNPAANQLLETGDREAAGRLLHEVARTPQLQELIDEVLSSGEEHYKELELTRQNRLVSTSCCPLELQPRRGAVLVLHDVTELRRLEHVRREFASNVSHELKTPLTSIQAYADALLDGALEDEGVNRGFVERILEQSERLRRLILDLLNLSRIESRDHSLELETLDLNTVVEPCLPLHQSVAEARGLTLTVDLAESPVMVAADPDALRTVIDNLIRNAISYTQPGGTVTLRTHFRGDDACLEVEDTGVGIAREHQHRIFERFFRVDKARSREVGGTGLGLSIVRHFVEHFGAVVELESEQGQGSLFRVRWLA